MNFFSKPWMTEEHSHGNIQTKGSLFNVLYIDSYVAHEQKFPCFSNQRAGRVHGWKHWWVNIDHCGRIKNSYYCHSLARLFQGWTVYFAGGRRRTSSF